MARALSIVAMLAFAGCAVRAKPAGIDAPYVACHSLRGLDVPLSADVVLRATAKFQAWARAEEEITGFMFGPQAEEPVRPVNSISHVWESVEGASVRSRDGWQILSAVRGGGRCGRGPERSICGCATKANHTRLDLLLSQLAMQRVEFMAWSL